VHHYGIEHRGRIYLNPRLRRDDALGQWVEVRYHEHHTHKVEVFVDGEYVCTAFESHAMSQGMQLGVVATRRADREKFTVLKRAADYQNALDERQRQIQAGVRESKLPTLPSLSEVDLAAINDEGGRRKRLCECPGVGLKTASWLLRNIGLAAQLAVIDVHVLRALVDAGRVSGARLPRDYVVVERQFLDWCDELGASPAAFDLLLWEWQRAT